LFNALSNTLQISDEDHLSQDAKDGGEGGAGVMISYAKHMLPQIDPFHRFSSLEAIPY
jgi:hypothetical protein